GRQHFVAGQARVAIGIGRDAFAQAGAGECKRAATLVGPGDFHRRLRLAAQVGGDVVRRRLVQATEARGAYLYQRGQVGNRRPHLGVVAPERLAARDALVRERELADVERQRPALLLRQVRVADHRGAFQALVDDLLEREHAALPRAL